MSRFVIVPAAWDTPATLEQYADAVRAVFPADLADVVLVGYSFGGFTAARIAVEHPEAPWASADPLRVSQQARVARLIGAKVTAH